MLRFEDHVLEARDADITIDVELVAVNKRLLEQAQVSRLLQLRRLLALLLVLLVLLSLDAIRNYLRLLREDIKCGICQHRHLHLDRFHLLSGRLLYLQNSFLGAFKRFLGKCHPVTAFILQVLAQVILEYYRLVLSIKNANKGDYRRVRVEPIAWSTTGFDHFINVRATTTAYDYNY